MTNGRVFISQFCQVGMKSKITFAVHIGDTYHDAGGHAVHKVKELNQATYMNEIFIYAAIKQVDDRQVLEGVESLGGIYVQDAVFLQDIRVDGMYLSYRKVLPVNGISLC